MLVHEKVFLTFCPWRLGCFCLLSSDGGLSGGEIAGIVIGVLAFLGVAGFVIHLSEENKKKKRAAAAQTQQREAAAAAVVRINAARAETDRVEAIRTARERPTAENTAEEVRDSILVDCQWHHRIKH